MTRAFRKTATWDGRNTKTNKFLLLLLPRKGDWESIGDYDNEGTIRCLGQLHEFLPIQSARDAFLDPSSLAKVGDR